MPEKLVKHQDKYDKRFKSIVIYQRVVYPSSKKVLKQILVTVVTVSIGNPVKWINRDKNKTRIF